MWSENAEVFFSFFVDLVSHLLRRLPELDVSSTVHAFAVLGNSVFESPGSPDRDTATWIRLVVGVVGR